MPYLLGIETATKVCSVGLFKGAELISLKEEKGDYSHAENLAIFTINILSQANLTVSDLSAIVVSRGPGSYTGLRIGVSFAKGLCYSLQIPLISIDTLHALALGWTQAGNGKKQFICAMIDARRMEVYSAIYTAEMECVKPISADIIDENSYNDVLKGQSTIFIGDGAAKCQNILLRDERTFYTNFMPSAAYLGQEGFRKFQNAETENVAYFEPYYLKEFVALKSAKGNLG
jgi:tRNA threonylcarbamoyladenosine biosynthesis protein TsaB